MDASLVELTFGDTLAIPGELISTTTPGKDAATRAKTLRNLHHDVVLMRPTPGTAHVEPAVHIPAALNDATHIHV